ncbi:MAG: hypothetical protein B6D41_22215, partial [Chloroflexi bacterium UTCFX4]
MSTPTDQQLVQYIVQGRRDALAQLFERYSADLYDYLARLVGDRDQAARLLETAFMRMPGAAPGFQARDSVRGGLYSMAREAGLDWLRQRGWLDGLPPSDEPIAPGLQGDVWKAARAMPAFFRAVLITEELQPLSPTEKARALGVSRTDLARLIEEARRSFQRIYDSQARAEGRPTSEQINPSTVWNARRRLPVEDGSLFGFLPLIALPDSLKDQIRRHVVEALSPAAARPAQIEQAPSGASAPTVVPNYPSAPSQAAPQTQAPVAPPPQPLRAEPTPPPARTSQETAARGFAIPTTAIGALIGVALALLICAGVFWATQKRGSVSITSVSPPNGATVQQAPQLNVFAAFKSDRAIDQSKSSIQVDGQNRVSVFFENTIAWTGALEIGSHTAVAQVVDDNGNRAEQNWTFWVAAEGATTPVFPTIPTGIATVTPIFPLTSEPPTVTPIIMTQAPIPTATFIVPTLPPGFTATPCTAGVTGAVFNDLNGNGIRDPNEPGLSNVNLTLLTQSNSWVGATTSDTLGNYLFAPVQLGFYRIQAQQPAGWFSTSSLTLAVNLLGCGTVNNFNFGFAQTPQSTPTGTSTNPPPTTPAPLFAVLNASSFVTPPFSATCPQTFTFNGSITTNGPGSVSYQWVRNDGTLSPVQTLNFIFAGTQNVLPDSFTLGSPGLNYSGWQRIQVLAPNNLSSPLANFSLNCPPATTVVPTTVVPTTVVPTTVVPPTTVAPP